MSDLPLDRMAAAVVHVLTVLRPELADPDAAAGQGIPATVELVRALRAADVPARSVVASIEPGASAAGIATRHHAAEVDGLHGPIVIDLAARQFFPDSPWPLVEPTEQWAARFPGGLEPRPLP